MHDHSSHSNDISKFQDFSVLKIQENHKKNYSGIIYSLLTYIQQQKTMDIKLPVPIIDAKTILSFSTLHK